MIIIMHPNDHYPDNQHHLHHGLDWTVYELFSSKSAFVLCPKLVARLCGHHIHDHKHSDHHHSNDHGRPYHHHIDQNTV